MPVRLFRQGKLRATKVDVLKYMVRVRRRVEVWEIEQHFGYIGNRGVYHALERLKQQGLVVSMIRRFWEPTDKGFKRLRYYESNGDARTNARKTKKELAAKVNELVQLKERVGNLEAENAKLRKTVGDLQAENAALGELVSALTRPGGLVGAVSRLTDQWRNLVEAYAYAVRQGVRSNRLDSKEPSLLLENLLKYIQLLPAEERRKALARIGF